MAPEDADFSDDFCQFLQTAVPAVEAAELLLLLKRDPARSWTRHELVAGLGTGSSLRDDEAERYLETLKGRGLVSAEAERLQYRAPGGSLAHYVDTLEKVYRERPVTLIRVIYGLRDSKIRSFADAFRLRRK
jgi:hypothetical protein